MTKRDLIEAMTKYYEAAGFTVEDVSIDENAPGIVDIQVRARASVFSIDLGVMTAVHGIFTPVVQSGCVHDLKEYMGLRETYKYCTKCPHKEGR